VVVVGDERVDGLLKFPAEPRKQQNPICQSV